MRVGIQTWGSEGDIRPLVALGHGLVQRGHEVELVYTDIADRHYVEVAASLGMTARAVATPVIADQNELHEIGLRVINASNPLADGKIVFDRLLKPVEDAIFAAAVDLCRRSDLIVSHLVLNQVRAAAELAGKPAVSVTLAHTIVPSRHNRPQGLPRLGEVANAAAWAVGRFMLNRVMLGRVNDFRRRVGVPPVKDLLLDGWASHLLNLIAVSPEICAEQPDWPRWNRVCGFLALPSTSHEQIVPELEAFLNAGEPPVFMGFGSLMPVSSSYLTDSVALMKEAARLAGCRAIIQAEMPPERSDRLVIIGRCPHAQVFPRCAAVVHHCGAGTTHTTLKAGVPSVGVPHVSDQFGWAEELQRLGVAPTVVVRRSLTAPKLARGITEVLAAPGMRSRAAAIAARMKDDDGPATAALMIEEAHRTWLANRSPQGF
ncbi:MAG: glycosyltransferase [Acidobacteria bacterium]|nr:glycosyltransferase [Acidobacteriota bacterium]